MSFAELKSQLLFGDEENQRLSKRVVCFGAVLFLVTCAR